MNFTDTLTPDVQVPMDAPAARCPYCQRPFPETDARDLHVGEVHSEACTQHERDAYEAASAAERDDLFYFHLRVVAVLGVLYGFVVILYMVALGSGFF